MEKKYKLKMVCVQDGEECCPYESAYESMEDVWAEAKFLNDFSGDDWDKVYFEIYDEDNNLIDTIGC